MTATFENFLSRSRERCNNLLASLLDEKCISGKLKEAVAHSLLSGGKRIRPGLAYAAAASVGEVNELTDYFACSVEAIHCYSLIHDDLPAMDDDDLRRGRPTTHRAFGEAHAILAGDALQTMAFQWLAEAPLTSAEIRIKAVQILSEAAGVRGMVLGQALDIEAQCNNIGVEALEYMHRSKTGALIRASLALGALSANADPQQLHAIDKFGAAIGLAFQVQDDILDVETDTQTLGKQQGADAALKKATYVSLIGLQGAKEKASCLFAEAMNALDNFGASAENLRSMAEFIVKRHY